MPNREWESVRLEDVLESVFAGAWGESPTDVRRSNVCVLRATNIDSEGGVDYSSPALRVLGAREVSRKRLRPGDLLLEASGGGPGTPVGRVALHDIESGGLDYICSNFFRVLRPKRNLVDPGYLTHVLVAAYRSPLIWRYQQQTTGLVNLKLGDYLRQSLWLPPISEQVKIVEIFAGFREAEQGIRASIAKLRSVRQGMVASLLSPVVMGQEAWAVTSLESVAEVGGGLALGGISATGGAVELPYLRVANVQDGFISTAEMKTVRVTPVDARRFRLRPGDVLVTEGGDFD
jgi:type I restriction enzyme S subunit